VSPQTLLRNGGNYTYRKNTVRDFYAMGETDQVEAVIAKACRELGIEYAFTGFSAARRIAPAVAGNAPWPTWHDLRGSAERQAEGGGQRANVSLLVPYDEGSSTWPARSTR